MYATPEYYTADYRKSHTVNMLLWKKKINS